MTYNLTGAAQPTLPNNQPSNVSVTLTFSANLQVANSTIAAEAYVFSPPLEVLSVALTAANKVTVYTLPQVGGVVYTVTVALTVLDSFSAVLATRQASFTGNDFVEPPFPGNLAATTLCPGEGVQLSWVPPSVPSSTTVTILRRLKAWPFDLTVTDYDVVYWGPRIGFAGVPFSFTDLGIKNYFQADVLLEGATTMTLSEPVSHSGSPPYTPITVGDTLIIYQAGQAGAGPGEGSTVIDPNNVQILTVTAGTPSSSYTITFTPPLNQLYKEYFLGRYSPLQPQTYYYYLVLYSFDAFNNLPVIPLYFPIAEANQVFALSIAQFNSNDFIWANHPATFKYRDGLPVAQGGGGGFLQQWTQVMGCWLNLMRGNMQAEQLLNDITKTPFNTLTALNQSLGIDPEGLAYDYDTLRRSLNSLTYIYKRKGTCPGITETVSMFTQWASVCVDFGSALCNTGASALTTWDGFSSEGYNQGIDGYFPNGVIQSGAGYLIDQSYGTFVGNTAQDLYDNGEIRGVFGDVMCVSTNVTDGSSYIAFNMTTPPVVATINSIGSGGAGTNTFLVEVTAIGFIQADSSGPVPGTTIQVTSTPAGSNMTDTLLDGTVVPHAEIWSVIGINTGLIALLVYAPGFGTLGGGSGFAAGDTISIGKSMIRSQYVGGNSSVTTSGQVITDPFGLWVPNQFAESFPGGLGTPMQFIDSGGFEFDIVSNDKFTITVASGFPSLEGTNLYQIAPAFTPTTPPASEPSLYYKAYSGVHTFLYEPMLDLTTVGTVYDPFNPLYYGQGLNLGGNWGPGDVGIYITTPIAVLDGRASIAFEGTLTLDPNQPAPTAGALVGMFLNPNQNQTQMFEILANSTTTVTVAGDMASLVALNQVYYILLPLDYVRFQRLNARLQNEFTDADTRVHLLLV